MQNDSPAAIAPDPEGLSLNARLKNFGLKESYASHLATGRRTPPLELALRIEKALGIPPSEWVDRRRRFEEAAAAAAADAATAISSGSPA